MFDINHSYIVFWICLLKPGSKSKKKNKKNKLDLIKLYFFGIAKETIDKMKSQPAEWKKIFANDMTIKKLIAKIYYHLIQLNIKKT